MRSTPAAFGTAKLWPDNGPYGIVWIAYGTVWNGACQLVDRGSGT